MAEPRILLYDIETSFNVVAKFSLRDEYVPHENIIQERFIICAAWKWLGESKIYTVSILDDPKRFQSNTSDDHYVVEALRDVIASADVVVAHNGNDFDYKWLAGRLLFHGLPPLPPVQQIDTYREAKKVFNLNAFRLDYLGKYLGLGRKIKTSTDLWLKVLRGNKTAIKTMLRYNKGDIILLEKIFLKMRPFMQGYINRQLHGNNGCPRCGSNKVQSRGTHRSLTQLYQRFQCISCGGWHRARKSSGHADVRVL